MNHKFIIFWNIAAVFFYWGQSWAGWSWPWLENRQAQDDYKQLTGLVLFLFILLQNTLLISRNWSTWKVHQRRLYRLHLQSSFFSMPLLFSHALKMGHHYTFLFSLTYSLNVLWGSLGPKALNIKSKPYGFYWMVSHIALSTFISLFIFFHIVITFYFN